MLNKVSSTISFERKQDIECVHQARKTLNSIFEKYVRNGMIREDVYGDVLILNRTGEKLTDNIAEIYKDDLLLSMPHLFKNSENLASDEQIRKMSLKEVQALLKTAQDTFKTALSSKYEELQKFKKGLKPTQKELLPQMKKHIDTPFLISIPKK